MLTNQPPRVLAGAGQASDPSVAAQKAQEKPRSRADFRTLVNYQWNRGRGCKAPGDDEDWRRGVCDDRGCDAALEVPEQPVAAVRSEHDQACVVFVGGLDDALPGWRRFNGLATRQKSGLDGQSCSMGSGELGGSPYLGGLVGVKVLGVGGCESHIGGLPDTDHQCISLARAALGRGLRDRGRGEFGSVVGEDHRPRRLP